MPKNDPFTLSLKKDLKEKGITLQETAEAICKSWSQFRREYRGKTKLGIMPVDTVASLAQEGLISESTIDTYWQAVRTELRFKKEKPCWKQSLIKIAISLYHKF